MLSQSFSPRTFLLVFPFRYFFFLLFGLVFVAYFGVSENLYEVENILLSFFFFYFCGSPEKFERLKLVSVYISAVGKSLPRLH